MPSDFDIECVCGCLLDTFGMCWSCGPLGMEKVQVLPGIELGMLGNHARLIFGGAGVGIDAAGLRVLSEALGVAAERLEGKRKAAPEPHKGGSPANRNRLMKLAQTGTQRYGPDAAMALVELPITAAGVLESMTDGPVQAYMVCGKEDVQALREFMLSRQGLAGLKRHLEAQ